MFKVESLLTAEHIEQIVESGEEAIARLEEFRDVFSGLSIKLLREEADKLIQDGPGWVLVRDGFNTREEAVIFTEGSYARHLNRELRVGEY